MPVSSAGFGTNLDVNSIVSQLMTVERRPLTLLAQQESRLQGQISSWGSLKGALSGLQGAVRQLDNLANFNLTKASVGDAGVATAAASSVATPGSYALKVIDLAQQHKLHSTPFATTGDSVGTGTLTFQFGTYASGPNSFTLNAAKAARTVTIAAGQDTLAGVRDAVNAANAGVSASIINDGTGNRLVFTSNDSGAASSIKLSVADGDGNALDNAGLSRLAFDPTLAAGSGRNLTQTAVAQDASIELDGIAVTSPTNSVASAIEGVTLNLLKTSAGATTTVSVQRDMQVVQKSIEGFVTAYNNAATAFRNLTSYNPATKQAGMLQGDGVASAVGNRLRATLNLALEAFSGTFSSLGQVGVSFQKDGSLALDATKLEAAISAAPNDIAALFTRTARASHTHVTYERSTNATQAGIYALSVSRVATRGALAGSAAAGLSITAGVNDTVALLVNGVAATVTLSAGTYASADALVAELQTRANGMAAFTDAGIGIDVTQSGGVLTATSKQYGSLSQVSATAGAGATNLFGAAPTATTGEDIAGTINGVAATGNGQMLAGASGQSCEGLQLKICAPETGNCGTVSYSVGYAAQLDRLISGMLDAAGAVAGRTDGIAARIKSLDRRQEQVNARLGDTEKRYRAQFVALDAALARMNTTSNFLSSQLANLPGSSSR